MEHKTVSQKLHIDIQLLFSILVLCSVGLVILYSAAGQEMEVVWKQVFRLVVAFLFMFGVAQLSPSTLKRWSLWIYLIGILLLIFVLLAGHIGKGAQRWLDLGIIRFQPSEIMKLAVPMMVAWFLADRTLPPGLGKIFVSSVIIFLPVILIAKQPDLGTAILVAAAGLSVLFIAGIRWRLLMILTVVTACLAPFLWHYMHDYQRKRVIMLFNPEQDPLGAGYHSIQSMIAIGSGGVYGKGWLNGTQSRLEFLPERSTDFIFAVFSEEFGLMGIMFLIAMYLIIIIRGLYISLSAQHTYGKLLGTGLILTFFVYVFVNMGMVTGQLPVVGIPLPLISLGGTSMVTLMIAFGILMSIHTNRRLLSH